MLDPLKEKRLRPAFVHRKSFIMTLQSFNCLPMIPAKTSDGSRGAAQDLAALPPLRKGTIFLLLEERPSITYTVLNRFLSQANKDGQDDETGSTGRRGPAKGLVVTRQFPPDLAKDHGLRDIPIHWLTTNLRPDQRTIAPSAITRLNLVMTEFVQEDSEGLAVVDCLEYLITQNSFEVVLRLIQAWNDKIVGTRKRILLSVDPLTLTIQQLHLIKKECQELNLS